MVFLDCAFSLVPAGVTGTRYRVTSFQREDLMSLLAGCEPCVLHHGDCTGADAEAHLLSGVLSIPRVIHPPRNSRFRAFCMPRPGDQLRAPLPYPERNRVIVGEVSYLIALPSSDSRPASVTGSGTWTTVGYAAQAGMATVILYPDGRVQVDGEPLVR